MIRRNLAAFSEFQVFLNYPFDVDFAPLANALSFAVIAGGLIPVCARDLSMPDRPRLDMLVEAIRHCHYSAHDFSRSTGEGPRNISRMNMPLEMEMALFHALNTQRHDHRRIFFVPNLVEYRMFVSDLAGLDPCEHNNRDDRLVGGMYDWLRGVVPANLFNSQPTVDVVEKFRYFKSRVQSFRGSGDRGILSHDETREVMYAMCEEIGWWDWRGNKLGQGEFPRVPLAVEEVAR